MRKAALIVAVVVVLGLGVAALMLAQALRSGFSTHEEPSAIEAVIARTIRHWAVPAGLRDAQNPMPLTPQVLVSARAHWADHCASCHGNDGRGQTSLGQKLYPRAPDMTQPATQSLSDGELFAIIENGIRLTGMPGWGDGTAASGKGSWELVHFIRHLPNITPEEIQEMERLNPKTPAEFQRMQEEEEFLSGSDTGDSADGHAHQH